MTKTCKNSVLLNNFLFWDIMDKMVVKGTLEFTSNFVFNKKTYGSK